MKIIALIPIVFLFGCVSPPDFPKADLRISKLPDIEAKQVKPLTVPDKPKGNVISVPNSEGDSRKVMTFTPDELKRLLSIHTAAQGNADMVEEMNKLLSMYIQQANMMKDLAELEEARAARLETDLAYSDYRLRQQQLESKIETWSWKIIAVLSLAVGL